MRNDRQDKTDVSKGEPMMQENTAPMVKRTRFSISVSSDMYDRLRAVVPQGRLAGLVDEIIMTTLDDPGLAARTVCRCRRLPVKL